MIAGRPIVVLCGCEPAAAMRAELERLGAHVLDIGQRDVALAVRHLRHALMHPMPTPSTNRLLERASPESSS